LSSRILIRLFSSANDNELSLLMMHAPEGLQDRHGSSALPTQNVRPHPEEPRSGVSKDEWHQLGLMVRDGATRLLTMRV
jgi:hypothetical protein